MTTAIGRGADGADQTLLPRTHREKHASAAPSAPVDFPSGSFPAIKRHYRICTICGADLTARREVGLPIAPPWPTAKVAA